MQFSKLFLAALSVACAQVAVAMPGSHATAAAGYLSFLDQYRLEHPDLTADQATSIQNIANLANNIKDTTPEAENAIRKEATAAFGSDGALAILNPGLASSTGNEKRTQECDCADASAFCPEGWSCEKGSEGCKKTWGCGFGGVYDCDGICQS